MKTNNVTTAMKKLFLAITLFFTVLVSQAQQAGYTRQDTLRGSITETRSWWNLTHYHLNVKVDPDKKYLSGSNLMKFKVLSEQKELQVELQKPMQITKIEYQKKTLNFRKEGYSYFIEIEEKLKIGEEYAVLIHFEGNPKVAVRPPWDGGITWQEDSEGMPFIASSNQGIGSSIWWPNKDHAYDEPDNGVLISVEVPQDLMNVSNGRLIKEERNKKAKTKTYHWEVKNPINNYGVNINVGNYVHFGHVYKGEKGPLDVDFYVLKQNLEKAKVQFKDADRTLQAFEHWFGPYPFYEDSYKLVEAPYLGMEHQSSVTYGNGYQNGYFGRDLSGTGWGLKFDFIIVHESGHEWFANNITYKDVADMWIHESFTNYSESLFLEYHYGKEAGMEYVRGTRIAISNDTPIIGVYNVHKKGSSDMYYKGGNMLNTIRQVVNDDEKWRSILRGLNSTFYHKTVTSKEIEEYMSDNSEKDLSKIFDQYLRTTKIPTFEYFLKDGKFMYRWSNTIEGFNMPLRISINEQEKWITPTTQWDGMELKKEENSVKVDPNFYISVLNILGD